MKKTQLLIAAAIVSIGFTACENKTETTKEVEVLNMYVDSVENLTPVYTTEYWTAIDNGYQERALRAEKDLADLTAEEKAKADASKARYAALKATYELKIKESAAAPVVTNTAPNFRTVLRDRLFGQGKVGDDMTFAYVTGANIRGVYSNFVEAIDGNKDNYTREDWDEINVLYEALDTRKNAVEKDLATKDNLAIAGMKLKYARINALHRGGTKVKENSDAKQ